MKIIFDNNVSIAINDSWQMLQSMPEDPPGTQVFGTATDNCECFFIAYPMGSQSTMPFDNPQEVIEGIHVALADDQALIEVNSGGTAETRTIYSIIKTKKQPAGVQYTLTMDVATQNGAIHLQGFFDEVGRTELRDTAVFEFMLRDGSVTNGFEGWMADPYDLNYQKPYLMNLSEREDYDEMFPAHPLSMARTFINELIVQ